jgi:hypothetical protein
MPAWHSSPVLQAWPQPPQWRAVESVLVHCPSQLTSGFRQRQAPTSQVCRKPQGELHAPQCASSRLRSTHAPPQSVSPWPHAAEQLPC